MAKRPEILVLRRQVASEIVRSVGPGGMYVIAPYFGMPAPRMSELARAQVDRCSLEWLVERVYRMGGSVALTVTLGDAGREFRRAHSHRRPLVPKLE